MHALFLVFGLSLLVLAVVDALWTTLWVDGSAGPVSSRLTTLLWRGIRTLFPTRHHRILSLAGPGILVATVLTWVLLIWAGWLLLYASTPGSLVESTTRDPADFIGRLYFVSYALFTMGNGDIVPVGHPWRIATALTTGSGMLLITLAVSYVLSVLSAVVQKRSFAASVVSLGRRGEELVETLWNGKDFSIAASLLPDLANRLNTLTEQHQAYPILHYYHSAHFHTASSPAIVILDEALSLLMEGVDDTARPHTAILQCLRLSTDSYLETLASAFIEPADDPPRPPSLERLLRTGIPVVDQHTFDQAIEDLSNRRRKLAGMVENDAWYWPGD